MSYPSDVFAVERMLLWGLSGLSVERDRPETEGWVKKVFSLQYRAQGPSLRSHDGRRRVRPQCQQRQAPARAETGRRQ